jgi:hypothetical protein
MYTKPGIVSEEGQNDQYIERELNKIFLVSSPSTAARRNVRTAEKRPDQYETTRRWIQPCRLREWEAAEVPMMVDRGSTLSSMEDGALLLVVRRKGVKPEPIMLYSSSEGAIPGKRE